MNDEIKIGKLKFGAEALSYRAGLKSVSLPYAELERAFMRIREAQSKMCCGTACFADCYLVLVSGGKEIAQIMMEKDDIKTALDQIAERSPETVIGKP